MYLRLYVRFCSVPFMGKVLLAFMYWAEMFVLVKLTSGTASCSLACGSLQTGRDCWLIRIKPDTLTPGPSNPGSDGENATIHHTTEATRVNTFRWMCRHALFSKHTRNLENPWETERTGVVLPFLKEITWIVPRSVTWCSIHPFKWNGVPGQHVTSSSFTVSNYSLLQ